MGEPSKRREHIALDLNVSGPWSTRKTRGHFWNVGVEMSGNSLSDLESQRVILREFLRKKEKEKFAFLKLTLSGKFRREQISESSTQMLAQGHVTQDKNSPT